MRTATILAATAMTVAAGAANAAERITVTGEAIDTWCYYSGVMGSPESTLGTAHHTCALWCAAGGIPVGLLAEDGTVYMVLKVEGDTATNGGDTMLQIASHQIRADGMHYVRDGVNYIVVNEVLADNGIVNESHEEWDITPSFAIPEPSE